VKGGREEIHGFLGVVIVSSGGKGKEDYRKKREGADPSLFFQNKKRRKEKVHLA